MHMPSKIIDISQPLDNDTVVDPPFMRPSIRYVTGKENAKLMCELFPGLKEEDLPGGEGWAMEHITLATHNGTHMDAPYHYNSKDRHGNRMPTIDEMPLDWYFRPGVKLDFRKFDDGLKMTIDIDPVRLARIEALLEDATARGVCQFGLHRQSSALVTCIVPSLMSGDHMHFIDGASGGYAQAASQMKAKLVA